MDEFLSHAIDIHTQYTEISSRSILVKGEYSILLTQFYSEFYLLNNRWQEEFILTLTTFRQILDYIIGKIIYPTRCLCHLHVLRQRSSRFPHGKPDNRY